MNQNFFIFEINSFQFIKRTFCSNTLQDIESHKLILVLFIFLLNTFAILSYMTDNNN